MTKKLLRFFVLILLWPNLSQSNGWEHTTIPITVLISALSDASAEIRMQAANSLGYRHQTIAVEHLVTLLDQGEPVARVRQAAYQSLGKIGKDQALESLAKCLANEPQASVGMGCVDALGSIPSGFSEELVIKTLADPSPAVRNTAITSLGNFPSEPVRQLLVAIINGEDRLEQIRAIRALGKTRNPRAAGDLLPLADIEAEENYLIEVLKAIASVGGVQTSDDIEKLYLQTDSDRLRRYALIALSSIRGDDAGNYAVDALTTKDLLTRLQALEILREADDKQITRRVVEAGLIHSHKLYQQPDDWSESTLQNPILELSLVNEFLRTVISLDPRYGYELFALVSGPNNLASTSPLMLRIAEGFYHARWQGLYALGYTYNPGAEKYLKQAINDSDHRIRAVALRSIGVYGAKTFPQEVAAAVKDESAEVRWTAARVIGRDRASNNVQALITMLDDVHATVRKEAALSLGYLGHKEAIDELEIVEKKDPAPRVREAASFTLSVLRAPIN